MRRYARFILRIGFSMMFVRNFLGVIAVVTLCLTCLDGCARTDTMRIDAAANAQNDAATSPTSDSPQNSDDVRKLDALWSERQTAGSENADYPIGPGDVLTVSVPEVEQLAQRRVRVSTRGTVELPLIGVVQAGGLSEDALARELDNKLEKFMYRPQATVFVDEYRNREVAVIGAVNRPGLVLLTSPSESLLEVLTQAGGLNGAASDEVVLIPSRPGTVSSAQWLSGSQSLPMSSRDQTENEAATAENRLMSNDSGHNEPTDASKAADGWPRSAQVDGTNSKSAYLTQALYPDAGASDSVSPLGKEVPKTSQPGNSLRARDDTQFAAATAHHSRLSVSPTMVGRDGDHTVVSPEDDAQARALAGAGDAITIKLKAQTLSGDGQYMNIPMRPGDVVIVPGGGDVMVVGWVHQPGRFQAGSGLTVLGAIGAAGGPMYAANTRNIALIRTGKGGSKITIPVDMDMITGGQANDLPVQANDVIDVPYSGLRIGPYIFYSILTKMGLGGPIIPY